MGSKSSNYRNKIKNNSCLNCSNNCVDVFCSTKCQNIYKINNILTQWKNGKILGHGGKTFKLKKCVRDYILEKYSYKCCLCGWNKFNEFSGKSALTVDHEDGNPENSTESNLRAICPNCDSLTSTYRGLNRGKGRRSILKNKQC